MPSQGRLTPDFNEANRFVRALARGQDTWHTWQTFDDDPQRKLATLGTIRHGNLKDSWKSLVALNKRRAGVHVCISQTDGQGRSDENIIAPRAIFMDFDGVEPTGDYPVPPSMTVRSRNGCHVYWLLNPTTDLDTWLHCQFVLSGIYGSDQSICTLPATLRVPGFLHNKADPFMVHLEQFDPDRRYDLGEIVGGFDIAELINEEIEKRREAKKRASQRPDGGVESYQNRLDRALACLDKCSAPSQGRNVYISKHVIPIGYRFGIGSHTDCSEWEEHVLRWCDRMGLYSRDFREHEVRASCRSVWKSLGKGVGFGTMLDRNSPEWEEKQRRYEAKQRQRQEREDASWALSLDYIDQMESGSAPEYEQQPAPWFHEQLRDATFEEGQPQQTLRNQFHSERGPANEPPAPNNRAAEAPISMGGGNGGPPFDGRLPFPGVKYTPLSEFEYRAADLAPDKHPLSVRGNAARFLERYQHAVRYCEPMAKWYVWTGQHWDSDDQSGVMNLGQQVAAQLHGLIDDESLNIAPPYPLEKWELAERKRKRDKLKSWVSRSERTAGIKEMVEFASWQKQIQVHPDELDKDDFLINTPSGVVDIRTLEVRNHDPSLHQTFTTPVPYNPDSKCPRWVEFVRWAMGGDEELVAFLQRAGGYSLTGSAREQVFFFCYGMGGNGKSTFLDALLELAGGYGRACSFDLFLSGPQQQSGPTPELLQLKGARMTYASEPEEGRALKEALIKRVTGGERMVARGLWSAPIEFYPKFSLWISANHKPQIKGTDEGIWRRPLLIPWDQSLTDEEKDPTLPAKLKDEYEGILAWFIQGAHEWYTKGLQIPERVRAATQEYRNDMDVLAGFIGQCCVTNPNGLKYITSSQDLYDAYRKWCEDAREKILSRKAFGQRLRQRGFESKKRSGRMHFLGIGLIEQEEQAPPEHMGFDDFDQYDDGRYPDP